MVTTTIHKLFGVGVKRGTWNGMERGMKYGMERQSKENSHKLFRLEKKKDTCFDYSACVLLHAKSGER